jgi:hypothetical protein
MFFSFEKIGAGAKCPKTQKSETVKIETGFGNFGVLHIGVSDILVSSILVSVSGILISDILFFGHFALVPKNYSQEVGGKKW